MPALRKKHFIVVLTLLFFLPSCSDSSEDAAEGQGEVAPNVNKKDFFTIEKKGFEFELYRKMTSNHLKGREIFSASSMVDEYHISIETYPIGFLKQEAEFPKNEQKQLEWFAEYHSHNLELRLISFEVEAPESVKVDQMPCYKKQISGRSFGFPKEKQFYLRYYRFKDTFVAIIGWTVEENRAKFKPLIQYMGMSFCAADS